MTAARRVATDRTPGTAGDYFVAGYPPGVSVVLKAGTFLGLNAHYHNYWNVPIEVKV